MLQQRRGARFDTRRGGPLASLHNNRAGITPADIPTRTSKGETDDVDA
jgi:hypothetical protein